MDRSYRFILTKTDSLVLKGIAICAMLCHHLFTCVPKTVGMDFSGMPLFLGQIGKSCVALFIFLSGYGLSIGYDSLKGYTQVDKCKACVCFLAKRFVHFYLQYWPIFFIFVSIGVFVFHRPLSLPYAVGPQYLAKHFLYDLLGMQGFQSYNETWWFNKLILLLYLLSPFIYYLVRKACVPTLFCCLLLLRFGHHLPFDIYFIDNYGLSFAFGMSVYIYRQQISVFMNKQPRWILLLIPFVIIVISILIRREGWLHMGGTRADAFIAFGLSLLVMVFTGFFDKARIFAFLGKHSGNIYLFHTFIYSKWFAPTIYRMESPLLIFILLLSVCILISIVIEWLKRNLGIYRIQAFFDKILR